MAHTYLVERDNIYSSVREREGQVFNDWKEEDLKFSFMADVAFNAEGIEDALNKLSLHFSQISKGQESELEFTGKMHIRRED